MTMSLKRMTLEIGEHFSKSNPWDMKWYDSIQKALQKILERYFEEASNYNATTKEKLIEFGSSYLKEDHEESLSKAGAIVINRLIDLEIDQFLRETDE